MAKSDRSIMGKESQWMIPERLETRTEARCEHYNQNESHKDCIIHFKVVKSTLQQFWKVEDDSYDTLNFYKLIYEEVIKFASRRLKKRVSRCCDRNCK
jgi:hypothetical protein